MYTFAGVKKALKTRKNPENTRFSGLFSMAEKEGFEPSTHPANILYLQRFPRFCWRFIGNLPLKKPRHRIDDGGKGRNASSRDAVISQGR